MSCGQVTLSFGSCLCVEQPLLCDLFAIMFGFFYFLELLLMNENLFLHICMFIFHFVVLLGQLHILSVDSCIQLLHFIDLPLQISVAINLPLQFLIALVFERCQLLYYHELLLLLGCLLLDGLLILCHLESFGFVLLLPVFLVFGKLYYLP